MKNLLALFFAFVFLRSFSQVSVVAAVSKNPVAQGEKFELTFTVLNHDVSTLQLPSFSGFEIVSGPNKSTSMEWVNGKKTESGSYSYTLKGNKPGKFAIGKATITEGNRTFSSDELNVTVTTETNSLGAHQLTDSQQNLFDDFFKSPDSLYFKDGKAMGGKKELVSTCALELNKKKNRKDDLNVDAEPTCECMYETIAKYYTYNEFMKSFGKKGADVFSMAMKESSPAYKEMLTCVLSNLKTESKVAETKNENKKKKDTSPKIEGDDFIEKAFVDACTKEAGKTKQVAELGIDVNTYCQCTWDKIKAKGLSLDKLEDLKDPNSPLFMEIITPCVTQAMGNSKGSLTEVTEKNADDILGGSAVEKISLVKMMGVYKIKVVISGIEKYFTLDSGASDVFINSDMERELLLDGQIKKSDYLSSKTYRIANGSMQECRRLKLNSIQLGNYTINHVTVAINDGADGLLLLGKSLLDKFSHWSIDNEKQELILTR